MLLWQLNLESAAKVRVYAVSAEPSAGPGAQTLTASRFDNTSSFFAATVTPGTVTIAPGLFTNGQTFYTHTLSQGAGGQTLTATRFDNAQTFYAATVVPGLVTLTAARFDNAQTFYSATISQGAGPQTLTASRFDNAPTFYSHTLTRGAVNLAPGLFTNTNSFYTATITQGPAILLAPLVVNTNTFYFHTLTGGVPIIRQKGLRKTRYTPTRVPADQRELTRYLQQELERLTDALESPFTHQLLERLHTEPQRKPVDRAYIAYADGSDWNPGGGEGIYAYYAGSWKKLG
jgi:hypothetical protein